MGSKEQRLIRNINKNTPKFNPSTEIGTDIHIPNHSGDLSAGNVIKTPSNDNDPVNKKYVDDENMWETADGETQMKTAAFLDMRNMRIVNCQNPVGQQDVVTKNYGDSVYIYSPPFTGGVARSIQYASDPRSSVFEGEAAFLYDPSTNTQTCDKITSNSGVDFNITSPTGTVTLGDGTAGVDYILKFDGETNDGIITWKEDEDRFECSDEFRVNDDFHVTGESFQPHAQTQPSRSLNTTYQNTTGHPIIVYGSCKCTARNDNVSYTAYFQCKTDGSSPPTTVRQTGGYNIRALVIASSNLDSVHHTFNFVVANNDYYRIDTTTVGGDASVILDDWNEVDF